MDKIIKMINEESWDEALATFLETFRKKNTDEKVYIAGATLMEHYEQWDTMFSLISDGLRLYPSSYELYILLGNYYMIGNPDQAYISYENALFHCISSSAPNNEDIAAITQLLRYCKDNNNISVNNVSFIILSYNTIDYTRNCIESIRNTCYVECYEIIIVDNASTDGSVEWLREQDDIILVENTENAGFPAGCNQGIKAACPENDIFLLNSDTVMLPQSLFWLRIGLYSSKNVGAAGGGTNLPGNSRIIDMQFETTEEHMTFCSGLNSPCLNPYEMKAYLIMFAMLIRRDALNKTGLLDERFSPGNFEDNDYGLRLLENGYKCILCHNSYICHFGSKSFGKDMDKYHRIIETNHKKLMYKWGLYDDHYTYARNDIISMINCHNDADISLLEVDCGLGETLARIKYLFPNASVHGIEPDERIASIGRNRLDINCGDIEVITLNDTKYDYIICSDVFDHVINPEEILIKLKDHLTKQGYLIAGVHNLMNASIIDNLLKGDFIYPNSCILGRSHTRFSTLSEMKHMFVNAGYRIVQIATIVSSPDSTEAHSELFNELMKIDGMASRASFDASQYIIKATPIL